MIDFRSDTQTRPTPAMLNQMMQAQTGDDVFGEDPTVNELEETFASMFGMEAALFCASGTMTNQIAIQCHTTPGSEVICESMSHIFVYEGGGIAFNSLCQARPISGDRGLLNATQVASVINPVDIHKPPTALVSLENTANRGGGSCYDFAEILKIREVCNRHELPLHLDGARLFNALVAKKESPKQYGKVFDSISVCLSKGLGAPVGSVLLGKSRFIHRARRMRKLLGGGMRQAGYIAAAGLFAIHHHVDRLQEDHDHAREIAAELAKKSFVGTILPVDTNIVIFEVLPPYTAQQLADKLLENHIRVIAISPSQIRMVTHLDISASMVSKTIDTIRRLEDI